MCIFGASGPHRRYFLAFFGLLFCVFARYGYDKATAFRQRSRFRAMWMPEKNESWVGVRFSNDFMTILGVALALNLLRFRVSFFFHPGGWNATRRFWPEVGQPPKRLSEWRVVQYLGPGALRAEYHAARNKFERFGGFLELTNRFEYVAEIMFFERFEFFICSTMWPYMCMCCGLFVPTQFHFE